MNPKDTESTEGKRKTKRKSVKKESQDLSQESSQTSQEKKPQPKFIDSSLSSLVKQIEKQSSKQKSKSSVVFARNYCYEVQQIPIKITISETRKLNILEEFILRAAIEFTPPPTTEELAKVLGLDIIFVRSAIERLVKLNCLEASPLKINITPQGEKCYQQGHVFSSPITKLIYAIADPLQAEIELKSDILNSETKVNSETKDLHSLEELVNLETRIPDINQLQIEQIQEAVRDLGLEVELLEDEQAITDFKVVGKPQTCLQSVFVFVLFDKLKGNYTTQVRRKRQILELPSTWLTELEILQKLYLELRDEPSSSVKNP
ncbi:hypothetical protein [Mastigocoleus testarum]|uniref:Uncharacterized protein n=1 Tax=Mastigocoleus testarum BC008 TaxID=371196 RepID=A0A0V7ZD60_9CYAN|nr:hypothetical protein [Mastigocoleus testarum]KST62458.1 hypothetical protein BC008_09825 [Mastigocoleus testarum BC008]